MITRARHAWRSPIGYHRTMAKPGPTTSGYIGRRAGNLLREARAMSGMSQRELAAAAGVPHSTIARIESSVRQPSLALLDRILIAADLDLKLRLEPYDDHDDVLDNLAALQPGRREQLGRSLDRMAAASRPVS